MTVLGICCDIGVDLVSVQPPLSNMKHKVEAFWREFFGIQLVLITSSSQSIDVRLIVISSSKLTPFLSSFRALASNVIEQAN